MEVKATGDRLNYAHRAASGGGAIEPPPAAVPIEPPPSFWVMPRPRRQTATASWVPGRISNRAAPRGLPVRPVPHADRRVMGWWSPDPRAIIPLDGLGVSRSLRRSCQRYEIGSTPPSPRSSTPAPTLGGRKAGSTPPSSTPTTRLHALGWAHSVEAWTLDEGRLAGGLYGVHVNGLFAGESMFHATPTRRRWPWWGSSTGCGRSAHPPRRAVAHAPPRAPGCRRRGPLPLPRVAPGGRGRPVRWA